MDSSASVLQQPLSRDESGTLLGQTMGLVAVTAGVTTAGLVEEILAKIPMPS